MALHVCCDLWLVFRSDTYECVLQVLLNYVLL